MFASILIAGLVAALTVAMALLRKEVKKRMSEIQIALDALIAQVAANTDVTASAVLAIQGLIAQLEAAQGDPVKVAEITAALKANTDALAAAIPAGTELPTP